VTADDVDRLFALPLEEFTAARDTLVKQLRSENRRDEAAEVAGLRKPVVAAWVVNRLVREHRKDARALVDSAAAIRSGRKGGDERLRASLDVLLRAARDLLASDGREPGDAVLREVATTLRAGAAEDPEVLMAGRLTRPLEPSGFAAMEGAKLSAAPARKADGGRSTPRRTARLDEARRAVDDARKAARALLRDADQAEREARRLRGEAELAAKRLEAAERKLAKARAG
jgi:hypothetical protein